MLIGARALVGGGARGAVAPNILEDDIFFTSKIMTVETKSSTTYSGPFTV